MGIFDFLREIPLSAVLREKLKDIEGEVAKLKSENEVLRSACETKDAQIREMSQKLLPQPESELEEAQLFILQVLARHSDLPEEQVAQMSHMGLQVAAFHLEELRRKKFVYASYAAGSDWSGEPARTFWSLDHAGREYLFHRGLIV